MRHEDYDELDRFLLFAEQLEEAQELLLAETVAKSRMAIILLDNLASILILNHARALFRASEESWWRETRRFSNRERAKIEQAFSRQVTLASSRPNGLPRSSEPMLDATGAAVFRVAHRYRNPIYHEDRHNPALLPVLGRLYLRAVCEAFARSEPEVGVSWVGIDRRVEPLRRFGIEPLASSTGGGAFWYSHVAAALTEPLTRDLPVALSAARRTLADDLVRRTQAAAQLLQDLLADGMKPDRIAFAIFWGEFWEAHGADDRLLDLDELRLGPLRATDRLDRQPLSDQDRESMAAADREYVDRIRKLQRDFEPSVTLDSLKTVPPAAERLARCRSLGSLLARYQDLDYELARLEDALDEVARGWDKMIQEEIDRARGK